MLARAEEAARHPLAGHRLLHAQVAEHRGAREHRARHPQQEEAAGEGGDGGVRVPLVLARLLAVLAVLVPW